VSGHSIRRTFGCFRGWGSLDGAPIVDPGRSYGAVFPGEGLQKGLNDRFGRKNIVNSTFRWDGHDLPPCPLIFQSRACLGDEITGSQAARERILILTRFEKCLGCASSTAVSGLVFSLAYLRRRSALESVTAHAFSDVLAVLGATMLAK